MHVLHRNHRHFPNWRLRRTPDHSHDGLVDMQDVKQSLSSEETRAQSQRNVLLFHTKPDLSEVILNHSG